MAKFKYEIEDIVAILEQQDDSDWAKCLIKVSWNDGVPTLDIRNLNLSEYKKGNKSPRVGKGISMTDDSFETLLETLILEGYLSKEEILKILNKRDSVFKIKVSDDKKRIYKFTVKR